MSLPEEDRRATMSFPQTSAQMQQQIISSILVIVIGYYAISYFDSWPSIFRRSTYEFVIRIIPSQLVYVLQQVSMRAGYLRPQDALYRKDDFGNSKKKEEALRRIFGQAGFPSVFKKARTLSGYDRLLPTTVETGPPGLGNWDNSCYQNSVLQALASLPAFQHYIHRSLQLCQKHNVGGETTEALEAFLDRLCDTSFAKSTVWTPAVLKSMDSWQQQDAQEYFSRVADAVEKEALQYTKMQQKEFSPGLSLIPVPNAASPSLAHSANNMPKSARSFMQAVLNNPMDGMQAQALECQTCGYSEGISLTQFNCLTLSLGLKGSCSVAQLLDEYTCPELIEGVECDQCTKDANDGTQQRDETDESDPATISGTKKRPKVLRTKAKQLTFGRLPRDLVFHINRSIFDEFGNQRKNSSFIQFDTTLEILGKWCAPIEGDSDVDGEDTKATYGLKCIITHFGRHDNGHYVAYAKRDKDWYSFNDEIVTKITEDDVLHRGNVFMLYYEMLDRTEVAYADARENMAIDDTESRIRVHSAVQATDQPRADNSGAVTLPIVSSMVSDTTSQPDQPLASITPTLPGV